jgi:hypothetical protein
MLALALAVSIPALAQFAPAPVPRKAKVELAFPTLELFALTTPMFMASDPAPLSLKERQEAQALFGPSLDYDAVRVVFADYPTSKAVVAGNVIRMPRGKYTLRWLMHELTHVWQFQTGGSSYISKSLCAQAEKGEGAYSYTLVPGKPLADYEVEQQAEIVERCYSFRESAECKPLLAELKKRFPVHRTNASAVEEASRVIVDPRLMPSPHLPARAGAGELPALMPQLELRF